MNARLRRPIAEITLLKKNLALHRFILICLWLGLLIDATADAQSLRASSSSLDKQNQQAKKHDFSFLRDSGQVKSFVGQGLLVPVRGSADFYLKDVSFPYARPQVRTFIERLSRQYRAACGERLGVTSLTRPKDRQPRNASSRSVHPTGMAIDLHRSWSRSCRNWIEGTLLHLEREGVLEATLEWRPIHYHLALFPSAYDSYLDRLARSGNSRAHHIVMRGDTLWNIAQRYDTTVWEVKEANGLRSNQIYPGQQLAVPAG